jgi:hypothetical protein
MLYKASDMWVYAKTFWINDMVHYLETYVIGYAMANKLPFKFTPTPGDTPNRATRRSLEANERKIQKLLRKKMKSEKALVVKLKAEVKTDV